MKNYKYLIIGGGMTADAAIRGIREIDPNGTIGLVSSESDPPYNRPPLSKGLWKGKPLEKIWRKTESMQVSFHLGQKIISLNAGEHRAEDSEGNIYTGEKILLATGGTPRRLPFGGEDIIYYRTLADYKRLLALTEQGKNDFAVIGGGFIGSEIAAALAMNGKKVTMLFPEDGIGVRIYPPALSQFINNYYRQKGVDVLTGEQITSLEPRDGRYVLHTQSGLEFIVDATVAGIGIQPNIELATSAGLQVASGILVDEYLATSHPGIYAAGDVAEVFNATLNKRIRVEHEDNANVMGKQAGRNMAGAQESYQHLSSFYSDLFDLGYEAVGELDVRMETFEDWKEPFKEGVVYYLAEGRVRGVLLWNVWDAVPKARALINEPGPFKPGDLKGRLP
jgi:NADPH-dependent 2,4-dienoyl-CoA reductase/sulfur reductase-like enzyme